MSSLEEAVNYDGAEGACGVDGGRLVKVQDAGVLNNIDRHIGGDKWIGESLRF